MTTFVLLVLLASAVFLLYRGLAYWSWVLPIGLSLGWWWVHSSPSVFLWALGAVPFVAAAVLFGFRPVRRKYVTKRVLQAMKPMFPPMSETERVALEAGTVWWDAELFTGNPKWKRLVDFRAPGLTPRETAFLANEVDEICAMVDPREVDDLGDLSEEAWQYLKKRGFMGLIIPEEYGGLGFSAEANSAVVTKVSSHNITLAVTVMVPNSLGPAELLLHYGTPEQKKHYLPRLADGTEIPAFALTEPEAGSDASSMTSSGVICKGEWEGEEVTGIRLNWNKRYITLAPVATLLGLAFKLYDPDHLLGDEEDLGITCALVPTDTPGVEVGERHDPLGVKFLNGPTKGKDVFVPIDAIIGGAERAGHGWRMLMDCLSAGRSISLPALSCGGAQVTARAISAYGAVREQFGMPIAKFEGIAEPLSRIAGQTWLLSAARKLTAGAVASGEKPSVISAIAKCYMTEGMRDIVIDGMDIQGGAGISRGPRNVLARAYQGLPIGITVEGANILTRTMIIYGQGAIRCHPYAFREMEAARRDDVVEFDKCFFRHVGFVMTSATRAALHAWTRGAFADAPVAGPTSRYFKSFTRMSAAFAITSDVAMGSLGGALKRKEALTGRLADCLAWMYMGSACLKRFIDEGQRPSDEPFMRWGCEYSLHRVQEALSGFFDNLPNRHAARVLRLLIFPFGRPFRPPSDRLSQSLVTALLEDDDVRDRLTADIYLPPEGKMGLGNLDKGWRILREAAAPRGKLKAAIRAKELPRKPEDELLEEAVEKGVLTQEESDAVRLSLEARNCLIQVDSFSPEAYLRRCGS